MNTLILPSLQNAFYRIQAYLTLKSHEWMGRIVIKLRVGLTYLEDRRVASAALLLVNFGILELASRISQLIGLCLPKQTPTQKHIKSAFEITLASGLTVAGNIALVKATGISINSLIIAAIIISAFIVKFNLENYLDPQPIPIDTV